MSHPATPAPEFLGLLANLNEIGAAINRIGSGEGVDARSALRLIVESAVRVVPGASAFIYTYDAAQERFDVDSRAVAGQRMAENSPDGPRPEGMGMRAIRQRRGVFSYEEPDLEIHPQLARVGGRAVACFPLIVAEQPVGALYVYVYEERPFTQLEQLMLANLVNHAAIALNQIRRMAGAQRDLARKEDELRHLRRAGLLISSRLRLEETLEAILQMALEVTGARFGIFRLLDPDGQNLITRVIAGDQLSRPRIEVLPIHENSVMSWVARHRRPALVRDLHEPPWREIYYPLDASLEMRAELAVPLIGASGRLEGVLNLESPQVGAFGEDDRRLLQALAAQAVIAIQEVRLLDALQDAAQWVVTQPYAEALWRLAGLGRQLLDGLACQVWTVRSGVLQLEVSSGAAPAEELLVLAQKMQQRALLEGRLQEHDSPARSQRVWVMPLGGAPASSVSHPAAEPLRAPVGEVSQLPEGETLHVPAGEALGMMTIYGPASAAGQSDWDHKVLTCLANYAVLAIQNSVHQQALRTAQEQRAVAETFAAVGDIAANLLHQLNNKIGAIPVRVQGIEDKCAGLVASDRYLAANLAEIERSASEAMDAVRVNLSQLRPIHLAEVNLADCVREALAGARLPQGVRVDLHNLEALPAVLAGQPSLVWVFANLFQNAAEALGGRGTIVISGAQRANQLEVEVSDDGPGIAPHLHERIFEWNYSGRRSQRTGLGFGLWWVKTLMARLGGTVSVESDGQHGTTFRLRLPVVEKGGGMY
jgi:signal transduction histidine kinase/putative methionine-R-sulfoxide reductase with GAF domain